MIFKEHVYQNINVKKYLLRLEIFLALLFSDIYRETTRARSNLVLY